MKATRACVFLLITTIAGGCGGRFDVRADGGSPPGSSIETGDGGTGLPCDVAAMLVANCTSCHGAQLTGGAPFALVTRPDLLAASTLDGANRAERSLIRMNDSASPMPPAPRPAVSSADIASFGSWLNAGAPDTGCTTPGEIIDAGPAPTTCQSKVSWSKGNDGSPDMNPGYACVSCHLGQNFQNQNPSGQRKTRFAFQFMGTIFPSLHEANLCDAKLPSGVTVEIVDKNGKVALNLGGNLLDGVVSRTSGNFSNYSTSSSVQLPYTARVRSNGKVLEMLTPQMSGDCNSCHTEQGLNGAPGRVSLP